MTSLPMGYYTVTNNTLIPNTGGSIAIGGTYQVPNYVYQAPVTNWGIASGATWNPNASPSSASPAGFQVREDWGEFKEGIDFVIPTEDEMEMAEAVAKWERYFKA